jgi:hypothetical protein
LKGHNVGITDGRVLWSAALRWALVACNTTKFHEDWYSRSGSIKILPQKFEKLSCWYYWWEGFMNYTVEMGWNAVIDTQSFAKIGSGIQNLRGIHMKTDSKVVS